MRIDNEIKLDFKDVLIRPKRSTLSSRSQVNLTRTFTFKHSQKTWEGVPIMAANMDGVGTLEMAEALSEFDLITCLVKSYGADQLSGYFGDLSSDRYAVSTGTGEKDFQNLETILTAFPEVQFICVDIANGYSEHFGDFIAKVRKQYPDKTIIAGNVVTADMTQELILRGADIIKVGIGPGAVCTTRIQTGVGYPQLSAVIECADAAHGLGGHIIADGGCTCPGDVAKAFGAGADFVMLGSMLSGHDEGGGRILRRWKHTGTYSKEGVAALKEQLYMLFYGMSSETAMNKHHGGIANYRSSEGRTVEVAYKGSVVHTIREILGGLRSSCSYVGAEELKHLSKCTTFIRVSDTHNRTYESSTIGK